MSASPAEGATRGGIWLLEDAAPDSILTPAGLSDEHRLVGRTAEEFMTNEVVPALDRLEQKDWTLARALFQQCGELGLLATDVPEAYGGVALDKASSVIVAEQMALSSSFATGFGAQTGLTIMPLLCFGTEEQKQRYLPDLASGRWVGAYALSESGSGSDALGARARATRHPDGGFTLNGEKMWITNGGFADVYIVFAKLDGEHFTAFIVERSSPGVSTGKEEHKMGLHGSSTTPLILQDVLVPERNLLGEIGKGHKVAFNVLNYGRFKLGAMCVGAAKLAIAEAAQYAAQRRQFGRPIATFGAIRYKLAEMTVRAFGVESMLYRTAGLIDATLAHRDANDGDATLAALEEFAVESSIAKVAGSEMLDYVLDENIQIHGGNGFVKDYPAERHYRDARVNRIFEGTNEINRLLIPGILIRRAVKGSLGLISAARKLQDEILSPAARETDDDSPLAAQRHTVESMKRVALMVLGSAMQTYGEKLNDEQEVMADAADIIIETFASESALLRGLQSLADGRATAELQRAAVCVLVNDAAGRVELAARRVLSAMGEGDTQRVMLAALRRLLRPAPVNTIEPRRRIADAAVGRGGYLFQGA